MCHMVQLSLASLWGYNRCLGTCVTGPVHPGPGKRREDEGNGWAGDGADDRIDHAIKGKHQSKEVDQPPDRKPTGQSDPEGLGVSVDELLPPAHGVMCEVHMIAWAAPRLLAAIMKAAALADVQAL